MRLPSRSGTAALVGLLVSSVIASGSYSLGLWLGGHSDNLRWIIYYSIPFAFLLGVAAAMQPRRAGDWKGHPLVAVLVGTALGLFYTYFVARFTLAIPAFVVLMLSCWVPSGISAMAAAAIGKRLSVVTGIAILCLSTILLTEPVFNAFAHNQQLTVALVTPSEMSTAQLEANPETLGFDNSDEIQTAKNQVLAHIRAVGYAEPFRVLSITKRGKGSDSVAIVVVRTPIVKEVILPEPDRSTVVYVQGSENWEKKPAQIPVLRRGIRMTPPGPTDNSLDYFHLGYFEIPDASGVSLIGRIIAKRPVQPR